MMINDEQLDAILEFGMGVEAGAYSQELGRKTLRAHLAAQIPEPSEEELRSLGKALMAALKDIARQRLPAEISDEDREYSDFEGAYAIIVRKARAALATPAEGTSECNWHYSPDEDDYWLTSCGAEWVMVADQPKDNGMNYCPKCGKKINYIPPEDEEEDDEQ
jgi:hypothetical protein